MTPSTIPTTSLPTMLPSITGSVVFVEMTQVVTESLTEDDVNDIIRAAEDAFGVPSTAILNVIIPSKKERLRDP